MSSGVTLTLNEDERTLLLAILEPVLRDKEIEVHRTEAPTYREYVERQEAVLQKLVDKLRSA